LGEGRRRRRRVSRKVAKAQRREGVASEAAAAGGEQGWSASDSADGDQNLFFSLSVAFSVLSACPP